MLVEIAISDATELERNVRRFIEFLVIDFVRDVNLLTEQFIFLSYFFL